VNEHSSGRVTFEWRGQFDSSEVNALHAEAFRHPVLEDDWRSQVERHSLGWVCARDNRELVGFVNVPWDGGTHAFISDTIVAANARRQGIGTQLVAIAAAEARAAGCDTLTSMTTCVPSTSTPAASGPVMQD